MDSVRLERETHWIFPRSVHESARRGMGPEVHGNQMIDGTKDMTGHDIRQLVDDMIKYGR